MGEKKTEHKKNHRNLYRELHSLAYQDSLTNLPNRRCFTQCLDRLLKQKHFQNSFTVMFIDLDRFKKINDTLGHSSGDILLIEAAGRLKSSIRRKDVVARIGGDEFICLLPNLVDKNAVEVIAERLLDEFTKPFSIMGQDIYISASIGLCLYPFDGESSEALISNADMAMYRAKRYGKNQFQWFQAEQQASAYETFILENHLRKAVQNNEFFLHYQPLVNLANDKVVSVEALIRWNHPEYGLIPPNEFIPLAEEAGMIMKIGNWVLREACSQKAKWTQQGFSSIKVAVNVSPRQFLLLDFPDTVKNILKETGVTANELIIEITENTIIQDFELATSNLDQLKSLGIDISIDDFGTGYSSLLYLSRLPIDHVKIDRSFIRDIDTNQKNKVLTNAMISLAHALEISTVAEGIETNLQKNEVKKMQCDVIQGNLISKPINADQVYLYFS